MCKFATGPAGRVRPKRRERKGLENSMVLKPSEHIRTKNAEIACRFLMLYEFKFYGALLLKIGNCCAFCGQSCKIVKFERALRLS